MRACLAGCLSLVAILVSSPVCARNHACQDDNISYLPVQEIGYNGTGVIIGVIDMEYALATQETFWVSADCQTSRLTNFDYGGSTTRVITQRAPPA